MGILAGENRSEWAGGRERQENGAREKGQEEEEEERAEVEELNSQKSVGGKKKRQEEHLAISLKHVYVSFPPSQTHNRPPDSYRGEPAPLEHWREREGTGATGVVRCAR